MKQTVNKITEILNYETNDQLTDFDIFTVEKIDNSLTSKTLFDVIGYNSETLEKRELGVYFGFNIELFTMSNIEYEIVINQIIYYQFNRMFNLKKYRKLFTNKSNDKDSLYIG